MKINRNNYEVFIIDYYDGKLNPVDTAELLYFLSENSDLEKQFNEFGEYGIIPGDSLFPEKESLKKGFKDVPGISDANFNEFCIASLEGDLDDFSGRKLQDYLLSHPSKVKEFQLFSKTKLIADKSVIYKGRQQLKRQRTFKINPLKALYYTGIVAAVFLLLIFLRNFNNPVEQVVSVSSGDLVADKNDNPHSGVAVKTKESDIEKHEKTNKKLVKSVKSIKSSQPTTDKDTIKPTPKPAFEGPLYRIKPIEVVQLEPEKMSSDNMLAKRVVNNNQSGKRPDTDENKRPLEKIKEDIDELHLAKAAEDINLWGLAESGLKGINYLTESDLQLIKKTDDKGKVIAYGFKSETFSFSTNRKK